MLAVYYPDNRPTMRKSYIDAIDVLISTFDDFQSRASDGVPSDVLI